MAISWKVAAAGGAALGLGIGGFTAANADDPSFEPVRDVDLQSARDSISSLSSPIRVTSTTVKEASVSPVAPAPAPAPAVDSAQSAASPVPAPAPAPAPVYDDTASPVQPAPSGGGDSDSAASAASAASAGGDST